MHKNPAVRPPARLVLLALLAGAASFGVLHFADARASAVRQPSDALVQPMALNITEQALVRSRAGAVARAVGISGDSGSPTRKFLALDHVVVDEVAVKQLDGTVQAVLRFDADRGLLRSLVRIGWSRDDDRPRIDARSAPASAVDFSAALGLTPPAAAPEAQWDASMRAWRVAWPRNVEGIAAPGEGLTTWVYPGGRLAAVRRIETPAAAAPLTRISAERAQAAARAWAEQTGIPDAMLSLAGPPALAWAPPNDFTSNGGADVTEARLYLSYLVPFTLKAANGDIRFMTILVDAGSGAVIGGAESA
ncbi:MAG: hypothetical protein ACRDF7_03360 [Candidatus Limnocylindrales bacterium]